MLSNNELIYRTRYYKRGKWLAISVAVKPWLAWRIV